MNTSMICRILLLVFLSNLSFGQNSLLWEITSPNLTDTSYLYGTIHLANKKYFYIHPEIHEIKKKVDVAVFEIVLNPDSISLINSFLKANNGEKIKDIFSVKEQILIFEYFQSKMGLQEFFINEFTPIALSTFLFQILIPPDTSGSIDQLLQNDFIKMDKKVIGLETVKMQHDILFGIPMNVQKKQLLESVINHDSLQLSINELDSVYCNKDLSGIASLLDDLNNKEYLTKELLNDSRNTKMIPKIELLLSKQSNLICVGAAHLGGKKGLINLLRNEGYKMNPIYK